MLTGPAGCMGRVTMFIGISAVVLTKGGLPRALGLLAVPIGALQLLDIGQGFFDHGAFDGIDGPLTAFVPSGTYLSWIIATGVVLIRRNRLPEAPAEQAVPAAV